jgi:hypothetical protein
MLTRAARTADIRKREETITTIAGPDHAEAAHGGELMERIERKFFIPPWRVGFAEAMLRQVCRPDREYPEGQVNTLYFDTPDLEQLERSSSGEFAKDKVRIRWYDRPADWDENVPVFVELKSRRGFASSKRRTRLTAPAQNLTPANLASGILGGTTIRETLASFGHFPDQPLRPVIFVAYRRSRFTEVFTGMRVSLDRRIRSTMIAHGLGDRERDLPLRGAVIEIKGDTMEIPATLRRMKLLDADWSRFSKYGNCVESHLAHPGIAGRLWPSGRNVQR